MRYAVDLAESELLAIVRDGPHVRLRLAAAAARNDAGERGWLGGVTLALAGAAIEGDVAHAFGRIAAGALREGARELARLQVPGQVAGDLGLRLRMANGTQFVVHAQSLTATLADGARFSDDLSC